MGTVPARREAVLKTFFAATTVAISLSTHARIDPIRPQSEASVGPMLVALM
jgi:hypothetical protein